jgi:MoxR-like ATPase
MRIKVGYPPKEVERELIERRRGSDPFEHLAPVVSQADLLAAQSAVSRIKISSEVVDYLHAIVLATRGTATIAVGASTRAGLFLERAVCAYAAVQGRFYATPDDVKAMAVPVLAHRVRVSGRRDQYATRSDAERAIDELLSYLPVPV